METWKPITDFPCYEVSDLGGVRRIWANGRPAALSPCSHKSGYLKVTLRRNPDQFTALVHRLVASAFIGPIDPLMQVNHRNGDKTDNRLSNLELVTNGENLRHRVDVLGQRPLHPGTGSKHHQAKLTEPDVLELRRLYAAGMDPKELAERFHIVRTTVYPIVSRKTWKHI